MENKSFGLQTWVDGSALPPGGGEFGEMLRKMGKRSGIPDPIEIKSLRIKID